MKKLKKIFNEEETAKLQDYLIVKFKKVIKDKSVFDVLPDMELWRMFLWWQKSDSKTLEELVDKELENGIPAAISFIKVFTPTITSYGNKNHQIFKSSFADTNFDAMTEVLNTSKIYDLLINNGFTAHNGNLEKNSSQDPLNDSELAGIFIDKYNKKQHYSQES